MNRLDLIIDALEDAVHNIAGDDTEDKCIAALAAARSLRELKPVAWVDDGHERLFLKLKGDQRNFDLWIPLYTLDEVENV